MTTATLTASNPRKVTTTDYVVFSVLWFVILLVSTIDIYWSIKVQSVLLSTELNPVGRWLIRADDGSVALFMACKFVGNFAAFFLALIMLHIKSKLCLASVSFVMVGQLCLLWFLYQ